MINIGTLLAVLNLQNNMSAGLAAAQTSLGNFQAATQVSDYQLTLLGRGMRQAGVVASALSAVIVGVAAGALKAAIDFESSFAGVRKTVEGTPEELSKLSEEFRKLALIIPINVNEINRIAEAGGQLGVAKEDLLEFTKVMAAMGVSTNLTSNQAAVGFAKFANIIKNEAGPQFDRLGATVVELGNKSAATESEILNFGLRLAGAGKVAKMSEAEILGFGTGLASLGIRAESGGTAFSKVFIGISKAVALGGEDLQKYAKIADMEVGKFSKLFKEDAAEAVLRFTEGLGKIDKAGGNLFLTLEQLGVKEVRLRDALLRTAVGGDTLRKSIEDGTKAWKDNSALTDEASKRYATMESQLILVKNQINEIAIELGNELIPILKEIIDASKPVLDTLMSMVKWFGDLEPVTQKVIIAFLALVATGGPLLIFFGQIIMAVGNISRGLALAFGASSVTGITIMTTAMKAFGVAVLLVGTGLLAWEIGTKIGEIKLFGLELTRWVTVLSAWALFLGKISIEELKAVEMSAQAAATAGRTTNIVLQATDEATARIKNSVDRGDEAIEKMFNLHNVMYKLGEDGKLSAGAMRLIATEALKLKDGGQQLTKELQKVVDVYGKIPKSAEEAADAQQELTKKQLAALKEHNKDVANNLQIEYEIRKNAWVTRNALSDFNAEREMERLEAEFKGEEAGRINNSKIQAELIKKSNEAQAKALDIHGLKLMKEAEDQYKEQEKEADKHSDRMGKIFSRMSDIIIDSFTGGGGLKGAVKGLAVLLTQELIEPLNKSLDDAQKKVVAMTSGIATAGTVALGAKVGLNSTTNSIIGMGTGLTGTYLAAVAAKAGMLGFAAGTTGATVAAGALTLGIGVAAVGVALLIKKWWDHKKSVKENTEEMLKFEEQIWATLTAEQIIETNGEAWKATVIGVREAYLATGRSIEDAERDVKALWDSVKEGKGATTAAIAVINQAFIEQKKEVEALDKAVKAYGLTFRNMGDDIIASNIIKIGKDLYDDFQRLILAGYEEQAVIKGMSKDMNQFIVDAVAANTGIPPGMQPMIEQMITMGLLTRDAAAAMLGLHDDSMPSLADITEAAGRYGIKLDELGPKVKQLQINETADQIVKDFELLEKAGADVGVLFDKMGPKIQGMVTDALRAGSTIPEGMKPLLEKMVLAGELVDENGVKLQDLSRFNFAKPLEKMFDDLIKKLDELIDKFEELAKLKLPSVPAAPTRNEDSTVHEQAAGGDYMVTKPTLFLAGEAGPERATFIPQGRGMANNRSGGNGGSLTIQVVMPDRRVLAEEVVQELPIVLRQLGLI